MPEKLNVSPSYAVDTGFMEGMTATIKDAKFTIFTYPSGIKATGLVITFESDELERPSEQFYGAGKPEDFLPTSDGKGLVRAEGGTRKALSRNCGTVVFLEECVNAGVSRDKMDNEIGEDISLLTGITGVITNKELGKDRKTGKVYTAQVFSEITSLPWEEGGGKSSAKSKAKSKSKKAEEPEEDEADVAAIASELIVSILKENDGEMSHDDLGNAVFQATRSTDDSRINGNKKEITQLVYDTEGFIADSDLWVFNPKKETLKLA